MEGNIKLKGIDCVIRFDVALGNELVIHSIKMVGCECNIMDLMDEKLVKSINFEQIDL